MNMFFHKNREEMCVWSLSKKVSRLFPALLVTIGITFLGSGKLSGQCVMICNSNLEISLFDRNNLVVTPDMVLVDPYDNCPFANFNIEIVDNLGHLVGNYVNSSHIGMELSLTITNTNSGTSCTTALTVTDNVPPVITCPDVFVACNEPVHPEHVGYPVVTDNVSDLDSSDLSYSDVYHVMDCFSVVGDSMVAARVDRIWQAVDASGNVGLKTQRIYYLRKTFEDIVFPKNRDDITLPSLKCHRDNPSDLNLTGTPTIAGRSIYNTNSCEFSVTFSDQVTINCTGEKRILRSWHVTDWCIDSMITIIQVIRVRDTQAPIISCPDTMFFNTFPNTCAATVTLLDPVVRDSCSSVSVTISWQFGKGKGPFTGVPLGSHRVTYVATDNCGNVATCSATVVVRDNELPTAVCDQSKEITLLADGTAVAFAGVFNAGSHDNCTIDRFEVSRDNQPFADRVSFTCSDLGRMVNVRFRVYDKNGFYNDCDVSVRVVDRVAPVVNCPTEVTLTCQQNFSDFNLTGFATATDNCAVKSVDFSDNIQLNTCGIGTILRTWLAEDASGNLASCTQRIQVIDNTPVSVTFPQNYTTYTCGASTDPSVTGMPVTTGAECKQVEISYTDQVFPTAPPACLKILRHWAVADWCTYVPGNGPTNGYWTFTQIIRVVDTIPPTLDIPANVTFGTRNDGCDATVNLANVTGNDCSQTVVVTNDSPYATRNGPNASGVYPKGRHIINFTAVDGCGNRTTKSMTIMVIDDKVPTPICLTGITLPLNSEGEVSITPAMISPGSFDNCSAVDKLKFEVFPNYFTCDDLGDHNVTLTITDEAGNKGFCHTAVKIIDNLNSCGSSNNKAIIAGKIETLGGTPAVQVLVGLSGAIPMGRQTHVDGTYKFENLPKGGDFTITPTYDGAPDAGVTTMDLVLIKKHILNVEVFQSPYQWIAADANNSKSITTLDMVYLRKLILKVSKELPNNKPWRFIDEAFTFPEGLDPLKVAFPESIQIVNLNKNMLNNHFVAVKIGDVNNSARLNTINDDEVDQRNLEMPVVVSVADLVLESGRTYALTFKAEQFDRVNGFQFTINFDKHILEYIDVQGGVLEDFDDRNFGLTLLREGALTVSWDIPHPVSKSTGERLFTLRFLAKTNGKLSDALHLSSEFTGAEAYITPAHDDLRTTAIQLKFDEPPMTENKDGISNYPNPFQQRTTLRFVLEHPADLTLTITDLYGKDIATIRKSFDKGSQHWLIDDTDLRGRTGVFLYRLQGNTIPAMTGKMIRTEP